MFDNIKQAYNIMLYDKIILMKTETPENKAVIANCGNCPYVVPSRISKVLYTCSLWGGVVKESDFACDSAVVMEGAFRMGGNN